MEFFTGRETDLNQMQAFLDPKSANQKMVLLHGLPGFGKTRLALRFIELHRERYEIVLWIGASSSTNIEMSFDQASFAIEDFEKSSVLSLPNHSTQQSAKRQRVKAYLERTLKKWLLVIDSFDAVDELNILDLIPRCNKGHVVITSIRSDISIENAVEVIHIVGLQDVHGTELLRHYTRIDFTSKEGKNRQMSARE